MDYINYLNTLLEDKTGLLTEMLRVRRQYKGAVKNGDTDMVNVYHTKLALVLRWCKKEGIKIGEGIDPR